MVYNVPLISAGGGTACVTTFSMNAPSRSCASIVNVAGNVATAVPLLFFGQAAKLLPLTMLGFLQYLSPTIQLLIAVLVLGEELSLVRFLCFCFIWMGLLIFSADSLRVYRQRAALQESLALLQALGDRNFCPEVRLSLGLVARTAGDEGIDQRQAPAEAPHAEPARGDLFHVREDVVGGPIELGETVQDETLAEKRRDHAP